MNNTGCSCINTLKKLQASEAINQGMEITPTRIINTITHLSDVAAYLFKVLRRKPFMRIGGCSCKPGTSGIQIGMCSGGGSLTQQRARMSQSYRKTLEKWLHGGYMNLKEKSLTSKLIAKSQCIHWRRGWDSNPRYLAVRLISSQVHSTTLPPLL